MGPNDESSIIAGTFRKDYLKGIGSQNSLICHTCNKKSLPLF